MEKKKWWRKFLGKFTNESTMNNMNMIKMVLMVPGIYQNLSSWFSDVIIPEKKIGNEVKPMVIHA